MNRQLLVGWAVLSGLVIASCQNSGNPSNEKESRVETLSQEAVLQRNQDSWKKIRPKAYRFRFRNPSSGVREDPWFVEELEITVIDHQSASVRRLDTQEYHWDASGFPTIDVVFEQVKSAINSDEDVQVEYDHRFGFPKFVDVGEIEADSGFQLHVTKFEELDFKQAKNLLPKPTELASQEATYLGLLRFPSPSPKDVIDWLETRRKQRNGVVCIWNIRSGKPILYGGRGDRGNDVEICIGGTELVLFQPATRPKFGLESFDLDKGTLNRTVEWSRPYSEFVGGRLSHDGDRYVMLQSTERIPVKSGEFTTNWSTKNGELRMVDARSGKDRWKKALETEVQFGSVCQFSLDNKKFGVSSIPASGASHSLKDKFVSFYKSVSGEIIHRCAGELLTFDRDGKSALVRRVFDKAPSYRLVRVDLVTKKEKELRASPYSSFRFAKFNKAGKLLVDVSAHKRSMHLDIELIDFQNGKSLGNIILPALNFNEKISISPSGMTFARLTRNGCNDCRIEIYDLDKAKKIQTLSFESDSPQNKGHMITDLVLIDDSRIATSHPLVIWRD